VALSFLNFYQLKAVKSCNNSLEKQKENLGEKEEALLNLKRQIYEFENNKAILEKRIYVLENSKKILINKFRDALKKDDLDQANNVLLNFKKLYPEINFEEEYKELYRQLLKIERAYKLAQEIEKIKNNNDGILIRDTYPSLSDVPKFFKGSNVQKLYEVLSVIPNKKTDYQTRDDLKKEIEKVINNNKPLKKLVDGYIMLTDNAEYDIKYDPEKKQFYFRYPVEARLGYNGGGNGGYIGENAFGVKKYVTKEEREYYDIDFLNKKNIRSSTSKKMHKEIEWCCDCNKNTEKFLELNEKYKYNSEEYKNFEDSAQNKLCNSMFLFKETKECVGVFVSQNISPEKLKPLLRFIYIIRPVAPYTSYRFGYNKATINAPTEVSWSNKGIYAHLFGLAVINSETGEVLFHKRFEP